MSTATVRLILARAVAEPEYRSLLLAHPAQATASYELTEAELLGLKNLRADEFDTLGADLERRESRAVNNLHNSNNDNMIVGDPIRSTNTADQQIVGDA
jgi:hypothetical protein